MRPFCTFATAIAGLALLCLAGTPASATTLIRAGLETLTDENEWVVHSKVLGASSYWNSDRSFILTDVRLQPMRFLKGSIAGDELVITIMGGTVGDLTTLIVGGPELQADSEYVLFLSRQDLPGVMARPSVRDLSQGVFAIVDAAGGRRAVSQATRMPLLPDAAGLSEPPGGNDGFTLEDLARRIRTLTGDR